MIQPPTACLPPIADIATFTSTQLSDALQYLYSLYLPQVRGSRRRAKTSSFGDIDDVQLVQSDAFERAYAIRWLTALFAQLEARQRRSQLNDTDSLIQQAASLLAICSGVAAAGKIQRQFTFQSTLAGEIRVALRDIPLDNHDYASVGAQTWGGACVLAEIIAERPDRFGLASARRPERPLRVLELGAGTGLVGLTVAKLLQALSHRATIVLTDFYPAVLDNLQSNIDTNFPADPDATVLVTSLPLDWSSFSPIDNVLSTPFDIIFGADIIYEAHHAIWIRDCLKTLLFHPDGSNDEPLFHLVIPLRPTHTFESSTVEHVFGCENHPPLSGLTILAKESIVCEAYAGGWFERGRADDDVEYVYYRIGWSR